MNSKVLLHTYVCTLCMYITNVHIRMYIMYLLMCMSKRIVCSHVVGTYVHCVASMIEHTVGMQQFVGQNCRGCWIINWLL